MGSEMCIRDRIKRLSKPAVIHMAVNRLRFKRYHLEAFVQLEPCGSLQRRLLQSGVRIFLASCATAGEGCQGKGCFKRLKKHMGKADDAKVPQAREIAHAVALSL